MKNGKHTQRARLKGVRISLSASPPPKHLRDYVKRMLDSGVAEDEVRRFIADHVVDNDEFGFGMVLGSIARWRVCLYVSPF